MGNSVSCVDSSTADHRTNDGGFKNDSFSVSYDSKKVSTMKKGSRMRATSDQVTQRPLSFAESQELMTQEFPSTGGVATSRARATQALQRRSSNGSDSRVLITEADIAADHGRMKVTVSIAEDAPVAVDMEGRDSDVTASFTPLSLASYDEMRSRFMKETPTVQ